MCAGGTMLQALCAHLQQVRRRRSARSSRRRVAVVPTGKASPGAASYRAAAATLNALQSCQPPERKAGPAAVMVAAGVTDPPPLVAGPLAVAGLQVAAESL